MMRHARELEIEGVISKRPTRPIAPAAATTGSRRRSTPTRNSSIVGYKDASHLKGAIGALVLGYNKNGKLRYAGRSGTGYTAKVARDLWKKLQPLRRKEPAFGKIPEEERGRKGIWVEPKLVAEVKFAGFTAQGHVRHAAFKGLREDKPAQEVVQEMPMPTKAKGSKAKKAAPAKKSAKRAAPAKAASASDRRGEVHPSRAHLLDRPGYHQAGPRRLLHVACGTPIAPHLVNRPLALVRCPDGIKGQCFFQKHAAAGLTSDHIKRHKDKEGEELIYVEDLDGLLTLVQAGVLEIHVWGSTIDDVEHANRIVFDLDPGDDVPWAAVNKAARDLRERLARSRSRQLREDDRRQGAACRGADRRHAVGRHEGLRARDGAGDGGG